MYQEIYVIDDVGDLNNIIKELFKNNKEFKFKNIKVSEIHEALMNIPALIIIDEDNIDCEIVELCKKIRNNEDNSITPIIVVSSIPEKEHLIKILATSVEYYIKKPIDNEYLYYTIKNIIRLLYTNRRVSPLTGLPGNVQIQAEIKKRMLINKDFSVLYLDLDNFKAYNDLYGFLKGDEIIKLTARTILNITHKLDGNNVFTGHIGGDDFVAIIDGLECEQICKEINDEFDKNVVKYFHDLDVERGYMESCNRKGIMEQFPLTSISIGVTICNKNRYKNILEIAEVGAQMNQYAKEIQGSAYIIDKRKM